MARHPNDSSVLNGIVAGSSLPRLPGRRWTMALYSAALHVAAALALAALAQRMTPPVPAAPTSPVAASPVDTRHIVFIVREANPAGGGGGGGGGNRQTGPVRHAESVGTDAITLRVARPVTSTGRVEDVPAMPSVLIDAKPLASGNVEQVGLPVGGVSFGTSTGPGSGGGVGEGVGTGIGSGRGPGIGPGSGGGIGGGVYRPGGSVTAPRVITEVKPTYTSEALAEKIQGSVLLEVVVRSNGLPSDIRVVRSLDPGGLDQQAIIAASRWRFEPGRLAGAPVDVLVTIMIDFWIR